MTQPDYPPRQPYPPPPWDNPPPPEHRSWFTRHKVLTGLLAAFALLFGIGGVSAALGGGDSGPKPLDPAASMVDTTTGTTPDPSSQYGEPETSDFKVSVRTTSKECFGEAGCLVEYKVSVTYSGPNLDPSKSYDVTYHVSGPQDGGQDDTIAVTGDQYEVPMEQTAQTPTSGTRLRAKVISVTGS